MSNILTYDLVYREKGAKLSRQIKIEFVSNYMQREIGGYFEEANRIKAQFDEMNDYVSLIAEARTIKAEGYKETVKELEEKKKIISDEIMKHTNSGLLNRKYDILIELLKDNGCKEEKLLDLAFWDRCVEPSEVLQILIKAWAKDQDKKKVNS